MFKEMRRKEKLLSNEESVNILNKGVYGTLATIGENGFPYSTPLNYAYKNNIIYFHSADIGNKIDNIKFCNKVSFSVVTYLKVLPESFGTEYDSTVIFGEAYEITDINEKKEGLRLLIEKYSDEFIEQGEEYISRAINRVAVYKIKILHMTGKKGR